MKVLVTGGTGFVGSHAIRALQAAGHEVRLLVRTPQKLDSVLKSQGIEIPEWVPGDISDAESVTRALTGCNAVVHAAASIHGNASQQDQNVAGTRNVLGTAHELGLDPMIHISTVVVLFPPPGNVISADDPVVEQTTPYGRSKLAAERYVRELQDRGAPIVTFYPAGVYGPDDPGPSEAMKGLRDALRFGWPVTPGGVSVVDVRDLARMIAAALVPGRGPRRYMTGGRFFRWDEKAELCDFLTGRRARRFRMPVAVAKGMGLLLDGAKKIVPFDYPLTYFAAQMMTSSFRCDSEPTVKELGVEFRPTAETLTDCIRWLHRVGQLPPKSAGKLATD